MDGKEKVSEVVKHFSHDEVIFILQSADATFFQCNRTRLDEHHDKDEDHLQTKR